MMRRFRVPVLHPCSIAGRATTDSKVAQGCCNDRGRLISARWLRDVADVSLFRHRSRDHAPCGAPMQSSFGCPKEVLLRSISGNASQITICFVDKFYMSEMADGSIPSWH